MPTESMRIIVSRLALPGWRARLGNEDLPVETVHGAVLAFRIPSDQTAEIKCDYFPPALIPGALLSALAASALVLLALRGI